MCVKLQGDQKPIEVLKAALVKDAVENVNAEQKEIEPKNLREESGGCPCCMLAAIRQGRSLLPTYSYAVYTNCSEHEPTGESDPYPYGVKFDFKAEMKTGIANINEANDPHAYLSY